MSQSGGQDLPNMMWQHDEDAFRRQLHMQQLHRHQQQHQQQHPHNLHFHQHVPSGGIDQQQSHLQDVNNANSLYMGGPLQHHHHQPAPINTAATGGAPAAGSDHLYSMLPMGNGSYLKVYHNQDDTMKFQNYELFSNNSFIQIPQQLSAAQLATNSTHHGLQTSMYPSQQQQQQQQPQQQMFFDLGSSAQSNNQQSSSTSAGVAPVQHQQNDNTNNVFINQLAENWVPNMSGTYTPFGEPQQHHSAIQLRQHCDIGGGGPEPFQPSLLCAAPLVQQQMPISLVDNHSPASPPQPPQLMSTVNSAIIGGDSQATLVEANLQTQSSGTNGSFLQLQHEEYASAAKKATTAAPKKPRMVAEVKPMRKTYADVVSKNVLAKKEEASVLSNIGGGTPVLESVIGGVKSGTSSKAPKENKVKQSYSSENKRNSYEDRSAQKNGAAHSKDATRPAPTKPQQACGNTNAEDRNKSPDYDNRSSGAGRPKKTNTQSSSTKTSSSSNKPKASTHGGETACSSASSKKKSSPASASDQELEDDSTSSTSKSSSSGCFLYNICKNESSSANKANSNGRKSAQSKQTVPGTGSAAASSSSGSGGGTRAGASKSERFTAYLHRRQQRSARQKSGYDLILKVLEKWLELVLRFALWLFDLVSDVVILSGSMLWDGSKFVFEYAKHLYEVARTELRQNSGKPTAICKAWLLQFDRQFAVDSRWAVWRRFVKKQVPATEQVRCGRLPTTGDEAMYSLLNCKGKDAYSILGVAADCSQEQLRKHYKKIAVLVHPDKNKQAGAEEAFKILQRSFELIGEPEARAAYDQSLAEALNAEKACSEINELLTQLQSKFAEAANTIRCSSCGLRHPRRPTGRPHFAARECSSCKIRHPAREGDIWAETTFFGLRWKYLALMEGKVFDITEWANCQKGALSHLQPNSHIVQYRIVLGNQQQQQPNQQQQQSQQQQQQQTNAGDRIGGKHANCEPSLDEFLDNLYSGQNPLGQSQPSGRRRGRKN